MPVLPGCVSEGSSLIDAIEMATNADSNSFINLLIFLQGSVRITGNTWPVPSTFRSICRPYPVKAVRGFPSVSVAPHEIPRSFFKSGRMTGGGKYIWLFFCPRSYQSCGRFHILPWDPAQPSAHLTVQKATLCKCKSGISE